MKRQVRQPRQARKRPRASVKTAGSTRYAEVRAKSTQSEGQQAVGATDSNGSELAEDLLLGAVAVAKELNWKGPNGQWNVRRVYHLKSSGALPIHNVPGLGICARRSSLRNFFSALDDRAIIPRTDTVTK
jgi:hypothetical protein